MKYETTSTTDYILEATDSGAPTIIDCRCVQEYYNPVSKRKWNYYATNIDYFMGFANFNRKYSNEPDNEKECHRIHLEV